MESYIRRVLVKGKSVQQDGKSYRRVTSLVVVKDVPGMAILGCLVEVADEPERALFYLTLNPSQIEPFKANHPGYEILENEDHGGGCVVISWRQYRSILDLV